MKPSRHRKPKKQCFFCPERARDVEGLSCPRAEPLLRSLHLWTLGDSPATLSVLKRGCYNLGTEVTLQTRAVFLVSQQQYKQ